MRSLSVALVGGAFLLAGMIQPVQAQSPVAAGIFAITYFDVAPANIIAIPNSANDIVRIAPLPVCPCSGLSSSGAMLAQPPRRRQIRAAERAR